MAIHIRTVLEMIWADQRDRIWPARSAMNVGRSSPLIIVQATSCS